MARRSKPWQRNPSSGRLVLALTAAALFAIVALAAIFSPFLDGVDATISSAVRGVGAGDLAPIERAVTFLGSWTFVMAATVAVAVWMLARRRLDAVVYLIATVPVGYLVARGLQAIIARPRPVGVNLVPLPREFSLPSGHTVAASLFFGALAVIVALNVDSSAAKKWTAALAVIVPTLVGFSRVYLGVHWFGDILAAWLYSIAWWSFTTAVYLGEIARRQDVPR